MECPLSNYFAEVYATLLLCWAIPSINTLSWYTLPHYIAGLYPILTHYWYKSKLITMLGISQFWCIDELYPIITHCWGIANINTLLSYNLSSSIVELWSILVYCCQLSRNVVDSQSESSNTSPNSAIKNRSNSITNRQPNTYMYLYGHKFKIIAVKGNPVDQWSCNSFSELIDEYQVYKTVR